MSILLAPKLMQNLSVAEINMQGTPTAPAYVALGTAAGLPVATEMSRDSLPQANNRLLLINAHDVERLAVARGVGDAAETVCRECLLRGYSSDLIAPCGCTGVRQWVHKECLDRVRVNSTRPRSVYNCPRCEHDYKLFPKAGETSSQRYRRAKFHALVLRDFFVVFCFVQLAIASVGAIVKAIDDASAYCVPECQDDNQTSLDCTICPPLKTRLFPRSMEDHDRITYYVCGVIGLLAIIGFFGLCNSCCRMIEVPAPVARPRPAVVYYRHRNCCEACCDGCCHECGRSTCRVCDDSCCCCCDSRSHSHRGSDCNCHKTSDDKEAAGVLILVVIIVILFAIIGIFYGIVLATALFQRIVQRHVHTLELRLITADYPVADLAKPLDDNIPYAQIVNDVREMV